MPSLINKRAVSELKYLLAQGHTDGAKLHPLFQARGLPRALIEQVLMGHISFASHPKTKPAPEVYEQLEQFDERFQEREAILKRYRKTIARHPDYPFFKKSQESCYDLGEYYVFGINEEGTMIPASFKTRMLCPKTINVAQIEGGRYKFPPASRYFGEAYYYPRKIIHRIAPKSPHPSEPG